MKTGADAMLARLRPLPVRLRIAHLAALVRWERARNAGSYLFPAECVGREDVAKRRSGGGDDVIEKIQLLRLVPADPHPSARFARVDLESELARLGPRKGEESRDGGRAG